MFSWYKYLIVNLVFSHLGVLSGNLFLIAPFPDLCLLVPFYLLCWLLLFIVFYIRMDWIRNWSQQGLQMDYEDSCLCEGTRQNIPAVDDILHIYLLKVKHEAIKLD